MKNLKRYLEFLKSFPPACFAFVMATEIISIDLHLQQNAYLSELFYVVGFIAYFLFIILYLTKIWQFPKAFKQDLIDVPNVFEFYTFVAGTNALFMRIWLGEHVFQVFYAGVFILIFNLILTYYIATALFSKQKKQFSEILSPMWLLSIIAFQSNAIVISQFSDKMNNLWLIAYCCWIIGIFLYLMIILFILYKLLLYPIKKNELTSSYWMCMGAAAIIVVAAYQLLNAQTSLQFLDQQLIIGTIQMLFWICATIWIPFLVIMAIFKYFIFRQPIQYHYSMWSLVFPLGMYHIATKACYELIHLPILEKITYYWQWLPTIFWVIVLLLFLKRKNTHLR